MSQQQMNFDESSYSQPGSSTAEDVRGHFGNDYFGPGQKLSGQEVSKSPTVAQRLLLGIVSLAFLFLVVRQGACSGLLSSDS
jgi:hypothetical protein